jgi:hypothetical protein
LTQFDTTIFAYLKTIANFLCEDEQLEKIYKDVRVGGLRVGAGLQKSKGNLTFECSLMIHYYSCIRNIN